MGAPNGNRAGVSLVELVVALTLFSILVATSLGFYRQQGSAFTEGNQRMAIMQNLRYGVNTVEQNLRTAGVNVPVVQPVIVYADTSVVAFNADYASNIEDDFFAVHYDYRLADDEVSALTPARKITIPLSSFTYPDSAYHWGSGNSPAETIIFYFAADTTTDRTDDYALFRQVNDGEAEAVARRLLRLDAPFLTYYRLVDGGSGSPIAEFSTGSLPLAHAVPIHGAPADTGAAARVDSIRAVRLTYGATNGLPGANESVREITRLIRLPNAGVETQPNCGNRPILGSSLSATGVDPGGTVAGHISLQWIRATDEVSGEQDVLRYVIWRRTSTLGGWGDPHASVPPGQSSYEYRDFSAVEGVDYSYALAAQDCTPQYSDVVTSGTASWSAP